MAYLIQDAEAHSAAGVDIGVEESGWELALQC